MNSREPQNTASTDERKTRELCGHERDGLRCMRAKGHAHAHEALTAFKTYTWK
jgi:hypothetical protein